MKKRTRSRRAGGITDTFNEWSASLSTGASELWNKTKQTASSSYSSLTGSTPTSTTSSYIPSYTSSSSYTQGGRRRKRSRRRMRGGSLAMNSAPISGIQTAKPQVWVGGRKTRRRMRKTRRYRR